MECILSSVILLVYTADPVIVQYLLCAGPFQHVIFNLKMVIVFTIATVHVGQTWIQSKYTKIITIQQQNVLEMLHLCYLMKYVQMKLKKWQNEQNCTSQDPHRVFMLMIN